MSSRRPSLRSLIPLSLLALAGCSAPPPARAPASSPGTGAALDAWDTESPAAAAQASRKLAPVAIAPVTIAARPEEPPRPRRAGRVAVHFQRADLTNALQFLADAGRFNLVLEGGLSGQVSASLLDVDPYDALVALAEANGATTSYDRRIVTVKHR
jgi:hypothetical protein